MGKICRTCKEEKDESQYYEHYHGCKKCVSQKRQLRYRTDRKYYLNNRYNVMKQRADGRYSYPTGARGKPICTREQFLQWFKETKDEFYALWAVYESSDFDLTKAPSVDRINNDRGYELENIRWITVHDNSVKQDKRWLDDEDSGESC